MPLKKFLQKQKKIMKKYTPKLLDKKFSSKEILFLKSDSETEQIVDITPEEYLSDKIHSDPAWMESFLQRLENTPIPNERFLCSVIRRNFSPLFPRDKTIPDNLTDNRTDKTYGTGKATGKSYAAKHTAFKNRAARNNGTALENETESDNRVVKSSGNTNQSIMHATEIMLAELAQNNHGLWDRIKENIFVLVTESRGTETDKAFVAGLKNNLSNICNIPVSIGAALFPFMDFTKRGTFHNAVKALDHSVFLGNNSMVFFDAVSLNISGDRLYHIGRTKEAAAEYQKGLEIERNNINLINSLGVCFGIMKELEMAKKEFEKAMTLDNNEVMAVYNTGLIYEITDDKQKALEYFCKASRINNRIFEVELAAGKLFYKTKQFDKALAHLKRASQINTTSSIPLRITGDLFLETGEYEKAVKNYKKAIKINPDDAFSLSGLSAAFEIQNKNLDIALSFARKSVSMEPNNPLLRARLDKIYRKKETDNIVRIKFEKSYT